MASTNPSDAVPPSSMEQVTSAVPQMGPGVHQRYSQLERERASTMGYGTHPPHGTYGSSYSSYPPHPYGNSPHGIYGGPPPPQGYPRGVYPTSSYGAGYGAGFSSVPPPPYTYGGGYESHYGGQPPPPGHPSYRRPSPIPPPSTAGPSVSSGSGALRGSNSLPPSAPPPSKQHSLVSAGSSSHLQNNNKDASPPDTKTANTNPTATSSVTEKRSSPRRSQETILQQKLQNLPDHVEVERLRAAAATEITTEEVKPIQTDFHFFVKDNIEKYRKLAEEEVRNSTKGNKSDAAGNDDDDDDDDDKRELDMYLVNSNMNMRLVHAWEALSKESRDSYMIQEENDRRRFMEEDEIASRHCATLTARGKSPRISDNKEQQQQAEKAKVKNEPENDESKAFVAAVPADKETDNEDKKTEEQDDTARDDLSQASKSDPTKRPVSKSPEVAGVAEDTQESPTKKNKTG